MESKGTSGCFTAIAVVIAVVMIGVVGLVCLIVMRVKHSNHEETHPITVATANSDGTIYFQNGQIPRYAPHQPGQSVSREQFVALKADPHATKLSRKTFQESANQCPVEWRLEAFEISDNNGTLTGSFRIPYQFQSGHSSQSNSIEIICEFTEESREGLLNIRRNDWVTVQGTLTFQNDNAIITDARIPNGASPAHAEDPSNR